MKDIKTLTAKSKWEKSNAKKRKRHVRPKKIAGKIMQVRILRRLVKKKRRKLRKKEGNENKKKDELMENPAVKSKRRGSGSVVHQHSVMFGKTGSQQVLISSDI